ncbi:T9SS type A sorting domain-containing protein [Bizionia gelidisalsuginis]|uniref:T9SS type A sorting domain-containing protein n=1 Tax=Bizionia gelidisalsuginis TaxID=291188 RepID=A0ABY3M6T6_9FLAO|nr:T9SS type A sorting domain-containing protein [Bizionia gelidisalsuginis]TYC07652.1 T9SS type A sorting domain-containing protein [Bizionia gelidisalsuginis]
MQLNNNDFDAGDTEGGRIYLIYTETSNGSINDDSCDVDITKPRFTLTQNNATLICDSNSPKTFTVNNENNSPGVQLYQWNIGNGWLYNGSSASNFTTTVNNVQLTPTLFPPDNVTVTPKLDGINFPQLTSNITLADFTSNNVITGDNAVCSTENFSVFGLASGTSVTSWSIDNTNIASISINGNQITLTPTGNGVINITATLTNSCGQTFDIFKNNVAIGSPAVTSYTIHGGHDNVGVNSTSQLNVDYVSGATGYYWFINAQNANCQNGGVLPSFQTGNGNTSTLTSASKYAFINWGTCTGNFVVNVRALNDCGASDISYKQVTIYANGNGGGNPCPQEPWELKVYQQPVKGGGIIVNKLPPSIPCNDLQLKSKSKIVNNVKIYDFFGNAVYKKQYYTNKFNLTELNLRTGNYVLEVLSLDGEILRKLIIIK